MRASLYIRGLKDPIELEEEEANVAQNLIQDATKPNDTPFVIEGIWAGKKADMKYVMFPKEDKRSYSSPIDPMGEVEAIEFEIEITPDRKKSEEIFGHRGSWEMFFCERRGATRVEITEIPDRGIKTHQIYVQDPVLFVLLQKQAARYGAWKSKKDYIEEMRVKELEKMSESVADSMRIENELS